MELDLATLFYMFFRLAPFILVSYFTLSAVINQDIKGIIYLVGVIVACFVSIIVGGLFFSTNGEAGSESLTTEQCQTFTISNQPISKVPLSMVVLTYTFVYLFYVISKYSLWSANIPTLVLFPTLILCDFGWNTSYKCFGIGACFCAFAVAGGIGLGWAYIIDSMGNPDLQYFNVGSNQQVCSSPSKQLFKCSFGTKSQNITELEQKAVNALGTVITDITNKDDAKAKADMPNADSAVNSL